MRPLSYALLLGGLMANLSWANNPTANLKIWNVDESCTGFRESDDPAKLVDETDYLQDRFNVALDMAIAVQNSLKFVLQPRPDRTKQKSNYIKWVRIAESMAAVLGFSPHPSKTEQASDPHWKSIFDVINKMVSTLPSSRNSPSKGYSTELQKLNPNHKPMLVCGDKWEWLDLNDPVPFNKKVTVGTYWEKRIKGKDYAGAWYKNYRFEFAKNDKGHVYCRRSAPATEAATVYLQDLIVMCDFWFDEYYKTTKVSLPDLKNIEDMVQDGDAIDFIREDLGVTIFHELTHWYGGVQVVSGKVRSVVTDQPCVDKDGKLLYRKKGTMDREALETKLTPDEMQAQGLAPILSYGVFCAFNLARSHPAPHDKWSGPAVALRNADSLTLFAMMMYLDDWVWAQEGLAREPGELYS